MAPWVVCLSLKASTLIFQDGVFSLFFSSVFSCAACNIVEVHRFLLKYMQDKVKFHEQQSLSS